MLLSIGCKSQSLNEISKDTDGGGSGGDTLAGGHGGSGNGPAAASRRGGTAVTGSAGRLGGASGGGAGSAAAAGAARGGLSRVQGTAVRHDVGFAGLLVSGIADVVGVAEIKELLADKGRHRLGIVLESRSAAVGAEAVVLEVSSRAVVLRLGVTAELRATVGLGAAPLGAFLSSGLVGVKLHVERAGVILNLGLGGNSTSSGESEDEGLGEHCEYVKGCE